MKTLQFSKPSLADVKRQLRSRRVLSIAVPALMVIIFVASIALTQIATSPKGNAPKPQSAAEYQKALKASVDNADGSPVSGRSPANQAQTSLATAASTPSGTGTRTEKVASAVTGTTSGNKVAPTQVYSAEQQKTGINDAGCFYDYGIPGQQCMPAHMANADGSLSCDAVRMHFPDGLKVSGTDRFHLDKNGDGTACGYGD